jgi:hypothetical protein
MRKLCFVLAVVLASIASFASGDEASQDPTPATTRTVSGHQIVHYKNGPVPVDLSSTPIAALVPSGSSYTVISGSGTSSGTFTIPSVPSGFYLLQVGSGYLCSRSRRTTFPV